MAFGSPVPLLPDASVLGGRDLVLALPLGLLGLALLRLGFLRGAGRALPEPSRPAWLRAIEGLAAALAALLVIVLVPLAAGAFREDAPLFATFAPPGTRVAAASAFLFFASQSLVEELLFRAALLTLLAAAGLLLARLARGPLAKDDPAAAPRFGRRWFVAGLGANALQAAGFGALHTGNPHATPLAVVNVALAGAVIGWLFWSGGGLAGSWAFHAAWNQGIAAFGLPVSGLTLGTPLVAAFTGAGRPLLSGGSFGPEGSAVTTVALAALLAFLVARSARRLPTL